MQIFFHADRDPDSNPHWNHYPDSGSRFCGPAVTGESSEFFSYERIRYLFHFMVRKNKLIGIVQVDEGLPTEVDT